MLWDPWSQLCLWHHYKRRELLTTEDHLIPPLQSQMQNWANLAKAYTFQLLAMKTICWQFILTSSNWEVNSFLKSNLLILLTNLMASGPITSWQIDGETVETVAEFIFLGSKITADGDCSHEIKRCLLLWRKVMTNLDSILKSRDIILPTKVHLVKAMVFPVVMYGCESWTVKKPEWRRIDVFELWCWRRLLRVPWTARRSNQSILEEINPGISLVWSHWC